MTITPEKLRKLAYNMHEASEGAHSAGLFRHALVESSAVKALRQAADEIERLQSDVTELMSAANEALNGQRVKP